MLSYRNAISPAYILLITLMALTLQGCALMPNSGPSRSQVMMSKSTDTQEGLIVVEVDDEVARKLAESKRQPTFSETFGNVKAAPYVIRPGDTVAITIWETPPAILFRSAQFNATVADMGVATVELPPQMVMDDGTITVPFAGRVPVAGRSVAKVESDIASRLDGQANSPQVVIRIVKNTASQVSVIGAVAKSANIPLTPKGEKLLDVLAEAGGVTQPLNKVSLQLSRKGVQAVMPLDKIVENPRENLTLLPGDVISAEFQPWTYSVLGAVGKSQEVPFEARGISLAQALSRAGGFNDMRADPGGVFVFRFEDAKLAPGLPSAIPPVDGKVPVVYRVDFNKPGTFFATQHFPVQDKDVMYVANMPAAELEKFLRMVGMVLTPTLNIGRYQLQVAD